MTTAQRVQRAEDNGFKYCIPGRFEKLRETFIFINHKRRGFSGDNQLESLCPSFTAYTAYPGGYPPPNVGPTWPRPTSQGGGGHQKAYTQQHVHSPGNLPPPKLVRRNHIFIYHWCDLYLGLVWVGWKNTMVFGQTFGVLVEWVVGGLFGPTGAWH